MLAPLVLLDQLARRATVFLVLRVIVVILAQLVHLAPKGKVILALQVPLAYLAFLEIKALKD